MPIPIPSIDRVMSNMKAMSAGASTNAIAFLRRSMTAQMTTAGSSVADLDFRILGVRRIQRSDSGIRVASAKRKRPGGDCRRVPLRYQRAKTHNCGQANFRYSRSPRRYVSNEPLMKFDIGHLLEANVSCACCATHEVTRTLQCR